MNRPVLVSALLFLATAALGAQEASQSDPYQGTSTPPSDGTIVTSSTPHAKPPAGHPAQPAQTPVSAPAQAQPAANADGPDGGIVAVEQNNPAPDQPALTTRNNAVDPDGDIVHPRPPRPGELPEGTTIRVRLQNRLSSASSEKGEAFQSKVASDVLRGDQVLIPAGTEIDGQVVEVSSGHPAGRGSLRLRPETIILSDGTRYQLHAYITQAPGSNTSIGSEGAVVPDSRMKRDGIEYGVAVGAGATAGAIVGGPVGALTGTLIGAGVVTAHLLISHPQAVLESGTVMEFTLSEPLQMTLASASQN
jgi:hypothetical protein